VKKLAKRIAEKRRARGEDRDWAPRVQKAVIAHELKQLQAIAVTLRRSHDISDIER
jgi:hypothetical protein